MDVKCTRVILLLSFQRITMQHIIQDIAATLHDFGIQGDKDHETVGLTSKSVRRRWACSAWVSFARCLAL